MIVVGKTKADIRSTSFELSRQEDSAAEVDETAIVSNDQHSPTSAKRNDGETLLATGSLMDLGTALMATCSD
jgi:hypothetical protein